MSWSSFDFELPLVTPSCFCISDCTCAPPNSSLCRYELELVDFEDPDDSEEVTGMLFEQRLEAAERRRVDGNALFKEGRLDAALSKYRWAPV